MQKSLTVSGAWTQRVAQGLERTGLDVRRLCAAIGVDHARLVDPDTRVPREQLERLWREARRQSVDRNLGLHAGAAIGPSITTPLSHLLLACRDLLDATRRAVELQLVVAPEPILELREERDAWAIVLAATSSDPAASRHPVEFTIAVLVGFAAFLTPDEFRPLRVDFRHPFPGDAGEHERVFGCPVNFGRSWNQIVVSAEAMQRPSTHFSPEMARQLEETAVRYVEQLGEPAIAARVRAMLNSRLRSGTFAIEAVAADLHLSRRTLQRRLEEEGTSFSVVLDETRRSLCLDRVRAGEPIESVALRAGFGSKRALLRAIKRWTGDTPSAYRARDAGA